MGLEIKGTGSSLPQLSVHNDEFTAKMDTSHEWIYKRTGIIRRRLAVNETAVSLAAGAARNALDMAGMDAKDIDVIILTTVSGDYITPASACAVQTELGNTTGVAFDISAGCTGFIYGIAIAEGLLQTLNKQNALVISSEVISRIIDWQDRSTCVLFGDGAGAAVVSASEKDGIIDHYVRSDGYGKDALYANGLPVNHYWRENETPDFLLKMKGKAVFEFAATAVMDCLKRIDKEIGLNNIDVIVPHQANKRIIDYAVKKAGIPREKMVINMENYANMSSASIPVTLDEAVREKRIHQGDNVAIIGFGAGYTWGHTVFEWTAENN